MRFGKGAQRGAGAQKAGPGLVPENVELYIGVFLAVDFCQRRDKVESQHRLVPEKVELYIGVKS